MRRQISGKISSMPKTVAGLYRLYLRTFIYRTSNTWAIAIILIYCSFVSDLIIKKNLKKKGKSGNFMVIKL